ncbi:DUF943 family protein [Cedecea sp. MMO-103]|uniref:DUF943 family protein n=1 Tax=Cedecea sp. MMO-103 TaxID=3081238 RepID=UPI003FA544CD
MLRPVEIIVVHQEDNYSDVLVENFPFTDREKKIWWKKQRYLKRKIRHTRTIPLPVTSPLYSGISATVIWKRGNTIDDVLMIYRRL